MYFETQQRVPLVVAYMHKIMYDNSIEMKKIIM